MIQWDKDGLEALGFLRVDLLALADETGQTNVIVWPRLAEKYRLAVLGQVQEEDGVLHLLARPLDIQ